MVPESLRKTSEIAGKSSIEYKLYLFRIYRVYFCRISFEILISYERIGLFREDIRPVEKSRVAIEIIIRLLEGSIGE